MTTVTLPRSGMGIEEGTIVRWLKAVGEHVRKGEPIVEVETAKAMQEVEAPVSGTLRAILLDVGQTATVDADIAIIDDHD
jgi:pyruvate/2-oxoglutarate dehydrogenase complex dihydrolipoamide acyltransferase (E2) component